MQDTTTHPGDKHGAGRMLELVRLAFARNREGRKVLLRSGARLLHFELSLLRGTEVLGRALCALRGTAHRLRAEGEAEAAAALERLVRHHVAARVAFGDLEAQEAYEHASELTRRRRRLTGESPGRRAPAFAAKKPFGTVRASLVRIPTRFH